LAQSIDIFRFTVSRRAPANAAVGVNQQCGGKHVPLQTTECHNQLIGHVAVAIEDACAVLWRLLLCGLPFARSTGDPPRKLGHNNKLTDQRTHSGIERCDTIGPRLDQRRCKDALLSDEPQLRCRPCRRSLDERFVSSSGDIAHNGTCRQCPKGKLHIDRLTCSVRCASLHLNEQRSFGQCQQTRRRRSHRRRRRRCKRSFQH
jgi:hypothetical protein